MARIPDVVTPRGDHVDDRHGEVVADPYRWLEDTDSPETRAWIRAQNDRTEAFLAGVPGRDAVRARLSELWDYPRSEVPFRAGTAWFQRRNSGLQDQSALYVMTAPDDEGRVLLDPHLLSRDGTVAVTSLAVTDDGSLLAYATSTAGSDWQTWHVREVASGTDRADLVEWSRYGRAAWRDASGFYYSATDRPVPGAELTGEVGLLRIFFHALGTSQAQDRLIFEAPEEPEQLPHASVTEDGRFLVISMSRGTGGFSRQRNGSLRRRPKARLTHRITVTAPLYPGFRYEAFLQVQNAAHGGPALEATGMPGFPPAPLQLGPRRAKGLLGDGQKEGLV
jgi:prolyl oligopeptidase